MLLSGRRIVISCLWCFLVCFLLTTWVTYVVNYPFALRAYVPRGGDGLIRVGRGCQRELSYDFYTPNKRLTELKPSIHASCELLKSGDKVEAVRVNGMLKAWNNSVTDKQFLRHISTCREIVPKFTGNFYVSDMEIDFPLGFTILVSYAEQSVQQYIRLLRFIYRPHNVYCIHIDQKSPENWIKSIVTFASCFSNIFIAKDAVKVTYASASILAAHLQCLKELSYTRLPWKYVIDLHGTELPVVTNRRIVEALKPLNGINAIKRGITLNDIDRSSMTYRKMTKKARFVPGVGMKMTKDPLGPVPYNMTLYKSADSPNSAFSREFVHFLMTDARSVALFDYLGDVLSAVEFFFNTLNNLPDAPGGRKEYYDRPSNEQPFIPTIAIRNWKNTGKPCMQGYYRRRICIVSASDLPWLSKASANQQFFFMNKYLMHYDHVVMDCMEEMLLNQNLQEYDKDCVTALHE